MTHTTELPTTRKAAQALGVPRYQGQACTAGHTEGRYTANKACVVCRGLADRVRRDARRTEEAARKRAYNRANPDKRQAERVRYRERYADEIAARQADYRRRDPNGTLAFTAECQAFEAAQRKAERRAQYLADAPARKARQREAAKQSRARALAAMTHEQHAERLAAQRAKYAKGIANNPERVQMTWRNQRSKRRARIRGNGGDATRSDIQVLFDWQDGKCAYCGDTNKMELDHKVPLSRGGLHCVGNMQWLCGYHNQHKRTATDTEYRQAHNIPAVTRWE